MEILSKEQILKQARMFEDYQGNESDILGAEKGGKFHGFIAGAEWAIEKLEADKAELLEALKELTDFLQWVFRKIDKGDTPKEIVRILLMNREKIDNKLKKGLNFNPKEEE